jgi:16S rRNA (adenine1518-N6/adenine1519-N6)-dimethyltransferase
MTDPLTQRDIRALLSEADLRPQRRLGQHFLVDGNLLRIVVREADLAPDDLVLEVGPGVGNLTDLLVEEAGWVVAVEVDPALAAIAEERLAGASNLDLVTGDILLDKHRVSPAVRKLLAERQAELGGRTKLVSNLPYAAATPLVAELILSDPTPNLLVFTVQEEVAERLVADPGTGQYGTVSVIVQALAQAEVLRRLPPSVFWPRPKVHSSLVRIWPSPARRRRIADLEVFRRVVEGLFGHRRKQAPRSLALAGPGDDSPDAWAARLEALELDPDARGETYAPEDIIRLANAVAERGP